MDAVERLVLHRLDEGRGADVRGDHALLDQHVRFVAGIWLHARDIELVVKEEVHLGALDLKDTTLVTRLL